MGLQMRPAATFVNCVHTMKITRKFIHQDIQLVILFPVLPAYKPIITGVVLCHKTFGGLRSKSYALFIPYTEERIRKVVKEL